VKQIRQRLTYANVVSSIALFLVLAGGAAYAAKVPKHSVGPRQLKANAVRTPHIKANAVTTRKIKKNAITAVKIRDNAIRDSKIADGAVTTPKIAGGAVTTAKIGDGAVTAAKIDVAGTPFGRIAHEARGGATVALSEALTAYPLGNATYTQPAGRDDTYVGALNVTIPDTCLGPRKVTVGILSDSPDPEAADDAEFLASRELVDTGSNALGVQIDVGPGVGFQPVGAVNHTLSLVARAKCEGGGGGVTASFGGIDVIGAK
jgi:hypothetical protein